MSLIVPHDGSGKPCHPGSNRATFYRGRLSFHQRKIEIQPGGKASQSWMEFDGSDLVRRTGQETRVTEAKHPMTLHCQQCNTVLGDSQGVCGEISCLDSIMCLSKFILGITTMITDYDSVI